jgi:microcompartment protein CcmL/EutN
MPEAVGVIETIGFPAVLAAADAMVKAGRVTLVHFDLAEKGNFYVVIRGHVAEVNSAMAAGIEAGENCFGGKVDLHYTVPNPPENIVSVLQLQYRDNLEQFRL